MDDLDHWESIILNFKELSVDVLKALKIYVVSQHLTSSKVQTVLVISNERFSVFCVFFVLCSLL